MKKKLITLLLAASMVASCFVGCGKEAANQTSETKQESSSQADSEEQATQAEEIANFNEEGYPIVNEEITLEVMLRIMDNDNLIDPDDMPAIQRLEELTGINIEWNVVKAADFTTKLNLAFASDEYPDIIINKQKAEMNVEEYGVTQGILVPMEELIAKYMPTYTERLAMSEVDLAGPQVASDGHTYTAGIMYGPLATADAYFFINQSWLDALNLKMPTTIDELTNVLRAFKTQDPNGNGEADEIPWTMPKNNVDRWAQMFGVPKYSRWMYIDDNKQVQFVPEDKTFREYIEWVHMCYEEGLLDAESLTQNSATQKAKLAEGNVGLFRATRLTGMGFDGSESTCTLFIPPQGAQVATNIDYLYPGCYITKTNEYPEASARLLDAMLDFEMMLSLVYGEQNNEERGWKYNDEGKVEIIQAKAGSTEPKNYLGTNMFALITKEFYEENMVKTALKAEAESYGERYREAGVLQKYADLNFLLVNFNGEEAERHTLIQADINNTMTEYIAKFVTEGVTDESWNEMLRILKDIGSEEYVQMYQKGIDALNLD